MLRILTSIDWRACGGLLNIPKVNRYKCTIQITKFKDNDAVASTSLKVIYEVLSSKLKMLLLLKMRTRGNISRHQFNGILNGFFSSFVRSYAF